MVREISVQYVKDMRWSEVAIKALQEATEEYLTEHFKKAYLAKQHANRTTLKVEDMRLVLRMSNISNEYDSEGKISEEHLSKKIKIAKELFDKSREEEKTNPLDKHAI